VTKSCWNYCSKRSRK